MTEKKTSKIFKSKVLAGVVQPVAYDFHIRKLDENTWSLWYAEEYSIKNKTQLNKALKNAVEIAEKIGMSARIVGNRLEITRKASFESIADQIVCEFAIMSNLGNITLRDLFIMLVGAMVKTKEVKKE